MTTKRNESPKRPLPQNVEAVKPDTWQLLIIANHVSTIDRLSDLRTESNVCWNPEPEWGPRGGIDE